MASLDKIIIKYRNKQESFIFNDNEYDWNNIIEIDENTDAKLILIGDNSSKLYLDGINILLLEAETKSELEYENSNKYYMDDDGAYVRFNQKEIVLFEVNNPLFSNNYMEHTLCPGYYRLMIVNSKNERSFSWLKIKAKQIGERQLHDLKEDLENTIQGLAKRFDRNDNGIIAFKNGITQHDLDLIELFHEEFNNFRRAIYHITNNPKYVIKNNYLWTDQLLSSLDYKSIKKTIDNSSKNKKYFSKFRYINYDLQTNSILKSQLNFIFKKINHLIQIIKNYIDLNKNDSSLLSELNLLKKYKYLIINFLSNPWIHDITPKDKLLFNNTYDNNYMYINRLIEKINHLMTDNQISFSRQYKYYYHRTDVLYEVWSYIKVIECLSKLGFIPQHGWIFSDKRENFGELHEGETVISNYDSNCSKIENKNCKYVKIVYDKMIDNRDKKSPVKMVFGYTRNKPDIRVEFYDAQDKIISLVIMDTKYRNYNSIFYSKKGNSTLKQFIEYVNGIIIKDEYKSDAVKKTEEMIGQTLKNSLFVLYPKFNKNKPKIKGEDNQYRINLIPNDENKDLYIYLEERIKKMNDYFNY